MSELSLPQAAGLALTNACGAGGEQARVYAKAVAYAVESGGCSGAISEVLAQAWAQANASGHALALALALAKASAGAATCSIKSQFPSLTGTSFLRGGLGGF